ncbi:DUF350 domain-containing protein [Sphingomonas sanxanigenens]|uniref:DUF350 domain-containing protein n=1 Tax=Sphingomonas sanxanigenens DSM 19645 = NX02 TaxID=1123269 RepID=W0A5X5_9SPHN|nr:DUF350 domain-containing protein [Sphingomonas sanxanigenens]AHE53364.1 hypothetical protein NX02_08200 [Sphingomonas sanxanigenens DSM 19645 = NX02]
MEPIVNSLLNGLPVLLVQLAAALAVFVAALAIYMWTTPHDEMALIRAGNRAAAISLGGAAVGLAMPMAASLHASVNLIDIIIWGVAILIVQVAAFRATDLFLRELPKRIERDEIGPALFLASIKLAVGLFAAAAFAG